jgi:hypothetical protein
MRLLRRGRVGAVLDMRKRQSRVQAGLLRGGPSSRPQERRPHDQGDEQPAPKRPEVHPHTPKSAYLTQVEPLPLSRLQLED